MENYVGFLSLLFRSGGDYGEQIKSKTSPLRVSIPFIQVRGRLHRTMYNVCLFQSWFLSLLFRSGGDYVVERVTECWDVQVSIPFIQVRGRLLKFLPTDGQVASVSIPFIQVRGRLLRDDGDGGG